MDDLLLQTTPDDNDHHEDDEEQQQRHHHQSSLGTAPSKERKFDEAAEDAIRDSFLLGQLLPYSKVRSLFVGIFFLFVSFRCVAFCVRSLFYVGF